MNNVFKRDVEKHESRSEAKKAKLLPKSITDGRPFKRTETKNKRDNVDSVNKEVEQSEDQDSAAESPLPEADQEPSGDSMNDDVDSEENLDKTEECLVNAVKHLSSAACDLHRGDARKQMSNFNSFSDDFELDKKLSAFRDSIADEGYEATSDDDDVPLFAKAPDPKQNMVVEPVVTSQVSEHLSAAPSGTKTAIEIGFAQPEPGCIASGISSEGRSRPDVGHLESATEAQEAWSTLPLDFNPAATWDSVAHLPPNFTCSYTRLMLKKHKWVNTKVVSKVSTTMTSVDVQRLDGLQFKIKINSGRTFQVAFLDHGLELVRVVSMYKDPNKKSSNSSRNQGSGVLANFFRVLRTDRAIEEAAQEEDLHLSSEGGDGQAMFSSTSLGKQSLRKVLELQLKGEKDYMNRTFHWGNVMYTTSVDNIVGLVGWLPDIFKGDKKRERDVLIEVKNLYSRTGRLPNMDLVFCGSPFDDVDPT